MVIMDTVTFGKVFLVGFFLVIAVVATVTQTYFTSRARATENKSWRPGAVRPTCERSFLFEKIFESTNEE